jgi:hypothetical protein
MKLLSQGSVVKSVTSWVLANCQVRAHEVPDDESPNSCLVALDGGRFLSEVRMSILTYAGVAILCRDTCCFVPCSLVRIGYAHAAIHAEIAAGMVPMNLARACGITPASAGARSTAPSDLQENDCASNAPS